MHGCGNDFVIIDNRDQKLELNNDEIKLLCDRHYGIGCDQLVVLDDTNKNNVSAYALFWNSDGSVSATCGNATRCIAAILFMETKTETLNIETQNGRSLGEVKFSSRTLDIDILYYDDIIDEKKNIPRSEITKFDFVLRPLYDLAPGHIHPNTRKTHNKMLADNSYQKMIIKRISLPLTV